MTVPSEKEVPLPRAAVGSHLKFQITLPDGSALSGVELLQGTRVANQNAVSAVTTNFGFTMLRVHSRVGCWFTCQGMHCPHILTKDDFRKLDWPRPRRRI